MSDLTLYRLIPPPGGGFHFGQEGIGLEESGLVFPSDALYSALIATVAEQEGASAASALVAALDAEPPFRISSIFPYAGRLPLLPLPQLRIETTEQLERKFTKKVRFVSPAILRRLCRGEMMDSFIDTEKNGRFLQGKSIWISAAEQEYLPATWTTLPAAALSTRRVWQGEQIPRVTIDRRTHAGALFRVGRVGFNAECGLWLAVRYRDLAAAQRLETLLTHLGDRGIGGERSAGYGGFTLQKDPDFVAEWPAGDGAYRLLLSRYLPRRDEMAALEKEAIAYRLVPVGGWLYSPQHPPLRRQRVSLMAAGSVLAGSSELGGRLADVTPNWPDFPHPVYRCGLSLSLPVSRYSQGGDT